MKQIKLTKGQFAIVDDEDYEFLMQYKWCLNGHYAASRTGGRYVSMQRLILNTPERMVCDHINGLKLDNRKENLRNCTQSQNYQNRRGKKGVCLDQGKWRAQIVYREDGVKVQKYLGRFESLEDAQKVYNEAVKVYHGEFGQLTNEVTQ